MKSSLSHKSEDEHFGRVDTNVGKAKEIVICYTQICGVYIYILTLSLYSLLCV